MPSLGLAVAAAVFAGGASLVAEEASKPKKVCINRREISSIRGLDDQHAFVKLGSSRQYLLTVDTACRGLKLARTIAISGGASRICGDGLTLLSFEYPMVGPMRCRIDLIDSVPDMNAALELIESRAPPK
jgi:hypothetical protein